MSGPDHEVGAGSADAELTRTKRALEALQAEHAAALEGHKAFAYSISHDLRAPLRAIDGFSRLLSEMPRDAWNADANRFLTIICDSVKTLNDQVDALLVLSRLEHQDLRPMAIDMTAVAQEVVNELRRREPERQVAVSIAALEPACGDLGMIRTAVAALATNAWKFTRREPSANIEIFSDQRNAETVYAVRDNGVGFANSSADRLFGVFRRLHPPSDFEGLGVGLAVVRTIVTRHRGRAWAEGEAGTGATFYFSLPLVGGPANDADAD